MVLDDNCDDGLIKGMSVIIWKGFKSCLHIAIWHIYTTYWSKNDNSREWICLDEVDCLHIQIKPSIYWLRRWLHFKSFRITSILVTLILYCALMSKLSYLSTYTQYQIIIPCCKYSTNFVGLKIWVDIQFG